MTIKYNIPAGEFESTSTVSFDMPSNELDVNKIIQCILCPNGNHLIISCGKDLKNFINTNQDNKKRLTMRLTLTTVDSWAFPNNNKE